MLKEEDLRMVKLERAGREGEAEDEGRVMRHQSPWGGGMSGGQNLGGDWV